MNTSQAQEFLGQLKKQDYYQRLGVEQGTDKREIRKSYSALVARWHPDRFAGQGADFLTCCQGIVSLYNEAYATLSNERKKEAYDEGLAALQASDGMHHAAVGQKINAAALVDVDNSFRIAKQLVERGHLPKAFELLNKVVSINPNLLEGQVLHAYVDGMLNLEMKGHVKKAIARLMELKEKSPNKAEVAYKIGYLYFSLGEYDPSERFFKESLKLDPNHKLSQRQLRLVDTRRKASAPSLMDKLKSLFSKG